MIYVVGIGPGKELYMTVQAKEILAKCKYIVGYTVYVDLLKSVFPDKKYLTTPMKKEIERCAMCFELAQNNKQDDIAMVCSGDAGVYGMASPMLQLSEKYENVDILIVPGITSANSGAALLGAPLNHDYCVISLSDLLTPWEIIEKRIRASIAGDFSIAIYNPSSKKRHDYLKRACEIMMDEGAREDRACGYVVNIGRDNTKTCVCTLKELSQTKVDMFTTVFIGNSMTYISNNKLITKRGYVLD